MKTLNSISKIMLVLMLTITSVFNSSCKKVITGPKGETGASGYAPVVKTFTNVTVTAYDAGLNSSVYVAVIPELTQSVIDNGTIVTSVKQLTGSNIDSTAWNSIPYNMNPNITTNSNYELKTIIKVGKVIFYSKNQSTDHFTLKVSLFK